MVLWLPFPDVVTWDVVLVTSSQSEYSVFVADFSHDVTSLIFVKGKSCIMALYVVLECVMTTTTLLDSGHNPLLEVSNSVTSKIALGNMHWHPACCDINNLYSDQEMNTPVHTHCPWATQWLILSMGYIELKLICTTPQSTTIVPAPGTNPLMLKYVASPKPGPTRPMKPFSGFERKLLTYNSLHWQWMGW